MNTGDRVKKFRKSLGLSQEELARKVGYTDRSSIAKIESNKAELSENKIKLLANALNVTASDILGISLSERISENREEYAKLQEKIKTASSDELPKLNKKRIALEEELFDLEMSAEFSGEKNNQIKITKEAVIEWVKTEATEYELRELIKEIASKI